MLVVYLLYRTHHCQAERITMRPFVTGETGFVANNIIAIRQLETGQVGAVCPDSGRDSDS